MGTYKRTPYKASSTRRGVVRRPKSFKWVKGKCKRMERRKISNALRLLGKTRTAYWYKGVYVGIVADKENYDTGGIGFPFQHIGADLSVFYYPSLCTLAQIVADTNQQFNFRYINGRVVFCPYWPVNTMLPSGLDVDVAQTTVPLGDYPRAFALNGDTINTRGNWTKATSLDKTDRNTNGTQQTVTWAPNFWTKCIVASWYVTIEFENHQARPVDVGAFLFKVKNDSVWESGALNQNLHIERWEYQMTDNYTPASMNQYGGILDRLKAQGKLPPKHFILLKSKFVRLGSNADTPPTNNPDVKKIGFSVKNMYKEFTKTGDYGAEEIPSGAVMFTQHLFDNYYIMIDAKYNAHTFAQVGYKIFKSVKYYLK